MSARPITEITHEAMTLLTREMGLVNTVRFLRQFNTGMGNYTEERDALLADLDTDEFLAEARRRFPPSSFDAGVPARDPDTPGYH